MRARSDAGQRRLHSGAPWWLLRSGLAEMPSPAPANIDVAIVGAGITGALLADALTQAGSQVLVIDRRSVGAGSTAASTALLLYDLDVELHDLIAMRGEVDAVHAYRLSAGAIRRLESIAASLPDDCGFARCPSLYLASRRRHRKRLDRECTARHHYGFAVQRWSEAEVEQRYGIASHGALWSAEAAVVDPVRLTRALLRRAIGRGAGVLSHTEVLEARATRTGVRLHTSRGNVEAGQLVYATGYEIPAGHPADMVDLNSSFALVTEPLETLGAWDDGCVVWETARPYAYARSTTDRRLVMGGADLPFKNAVLRDTAMPARIHRLEERMQRWFPSVPARTAFSWAGTFGETSDGLPYIDASPVLPHTWLALGYGGNGITFGVVAADILADLCQQRPCDDAHPFRLNR